MANVFDTLSMAVKSRIGQTAQKLFSATPIGATYNSYQTFTSPPVQNVINKIPLQQAFTNAQPATRLLPIGQQMFSNLIYNPKENKLFPNSYLRTENLPNFSPNQTPEQRKLENDKMMSSVMAYGMGLKFKPTPLANPNYFAQQATAKAKLERLLNYDKDLTRAGVPAPARAKLDVKGGMNYLNQELPGKWQYNKQAIDIANLKAIGQEEASSGFKGKYNSAFRPEENLTFDLKKAFQEHSTELKTGKVQAIKISQYFSKSNLSPQKEFQLVKYSQNPSPSTAKMYGLTPDDIAKGQKLLFEHKAFNDDLFKRAGDAGLDINYLQNHIYQKWKGSLAQQDEIIAKGLGKKPGFSQHRVIPDFQTGLNLGLEPKFTTFAQLDALAEEAFHKALANKKLADTMVNSGQILPASQAPKSWKTIQAPLFPDANVRVGVDKYIKEPYAAPPQLAKFVDNYFGGVELSPSGKLIQFGAKVSGKAQDVVLSGGFKTVNFYTLGQYFGDLTTSLGKLLTGHPVSAYKTMSGSTQALLRDFLPGVGGKLSKNFEMEHFKTIEQMSKEGLGYGGNLNYDRLAINTVSPNGGQGVLNNLFNNPTFKSYLWQRRVSLFENIRDEAFSKTKNNIEATRIAGQTLKNYDGIVENLGRSPDLENGIKAVFMAPKYREGLINTFANVPKGFVNFKDPSFQMSRQLGVGLVSMLFIYNEINKRLNGGKNIWENPSGKELEIVIPSPTEDNPKNYYSVPFMPGKTAIFRRAIGTVLGILKGDKTEAVKQFSGLFSIPVSKIGELYSNKDYFGRDVIKGDTENYGSKPLQLARWGIKSFTSGPIREAENYLEDLEAYNKKTALGKTARPPNLTMAILRSGEIPIKQGSFPNEYYSALKEISKKYDPKTIKLYDTVHPQLAEFEVNDGKTIQEKMSIAQARAFNPNLIMMEREVAIKTAQLQGKPIDPIYTVPLEDAIRYYTYQSLPPGSSDKKAITAAYPGVVNLMNQRSAYFEANPITNTNPTGQPFASKRAQALMDQKQWNDPEVKAYLAANDQWKNEQRALLGLPEIPEYQPYQKKVRKIGLKKMSVKKIPLAKAKPVKIPKLKKLGKLKKVKLLSLKAISKSSKAQPRTEARRITLGG